MKTWQLQEAKAKLSELVEKAMDGEPQLVTKHGEKAVVVLDYEEYRKLEAKQMSLYDVLKSAPKLTEEEIALFERDRSTTSKRDDDLDELFQ